MKTNYNPFEQGSFSMAAPSTEAQREIWATIQMSSEATLSYNEVLEVSLKGDLDLQALEQSLQFTINNHDVLRSVYSADGKTFMIQDHASVKLPLFDLSQDPNRTQRLEEIKKEQIQLPFNLRNGPCIRFVLVRISLNHYALLVSAHHIVCDGWSIAILLTEISHIYSSILIKEKHSTTKAAQFADYALEESQNGQDLSHKNYWMEQFRKPLNVNSFPTDFKRPAFRSYDSQFHQIDIPDELVLKLKRLGMTQKSSFYNVLMANFMILIKKISHSEDIVVGVASAAQSGTGKHDLVGHLVNLLPIRTLIDENTTFSQFLRSLRTTMLDAFDHQFFSYGALLKELNIARDPSEIPLLNCVFNIDQQTPGQGLKFSNVEAAYVVVPRAYENFELFVNAVSCENKLSIECQYNSKLFERATIENWFECYVELLRLSLQLVDAPINEMALPKLKIPQKQITSQVVKALDGFRNEDVEAKLRQLWQTVLGVETVSAEDNFFVLGGHSLLAVELAAMVQNEYKKEISIRDIFEYPTVIELAKRIGELSQSQAQLVVLESRPDITLGPVSHNQMQIWYVEELFADTKMHNLSTSLRIKWDVNPKLLEQTVHFFLARHEALRTAIEVDNGEPFQKIYDVNDPRFRPELEVVKTEEKKVLDLMRSETAKSFDKTRAPMFRAKLFQLGESDFVFFFMVHHAVWDGWCFDIFFEELDVIYTALEKGMRPVFNRNPEVRYLDYTLWLEKCLKSGNFDSQISYWKNKLKAPLPILEIPGDYLRPKNPSHVGGNFRFAFSPAQIVKLKTFAASKNTTVFNVLLTAFKITMAHQTGLQDIVVGSPVRGRNNPELLQTIGYFVNTLALRSHIDSAESFEENLKRVTTTCLEAFSNQDLPFELLLRNVDYTRDLTRTAIFQTFFTFQDMTNRQFYINERPVHQVSVNNASAKTDLDIWVKVTTTSIEGAFEYRSDLFETSTIQGIYNCFEGIINNLSDSDSIQMVLPQLKKNTSPLSYKVNPIVPLQGLANAVLPELPSLTVSLLPIRKTGSGLPIFFFHGVGGNVLNYIPLMKHIDQNRPIFALQSQGLDGKNPLKESIEDMARGYIREMKMISSQGPYTLIGGSMGGMIAFEVAQQLKVNDDIVAKLIVLDTFGPDINIQTYDESERGYFENLKVSLFYRRRTLMSKLRKFFCQALGLAIPLEIRLFDTEMANYRALWKYKPQSYRGDLFLIRAPQRSSGWYSDPLMGWGKTIQGKVQSVEIEGTHSDFIESPKLGQVLGEVLKT